jgi:hypothetical protein
MQQVASSERRLMFSRRNLMKGGVATGIVVSAPLVPSFAWATEYEPEVRDEALDLAEAAPIADPVPHSHEAATDLVPQSSSGAVLKLPAQEVTHDQMVAVSWLGASAGSAAVRRRTATGWSEWTELHVDPTERPDETEGPVDWRQYSALEWVGDADMVEVTVPSGVDDPILHVIGDSQRPTLVAKEATAGALGSILRRSAWGARAFKGTPSIARELKLAIVHHSAGSNNYTREQVPGIIRGIQIFHQDTRGWNDIAYNFVVDKFGRIWEARAGGIDKAVIGGHTFGCNTGTLGVCYLGTLTNGVGLPSAAEASIASLISWKFNQVHAVPPTGTTQYAPLSSNSASKFQANVTSEHPTVVGHSHFSSTQCPGHASTRVTSIRNELTRMDTVLGVDTSPKGGYWLTDARGQAHPRRGAPFFGSMAGTALNAPMIGLAPTASGAGYWMLARDGGIFSFGDARFQGSTGGLRLNRPVVGMATTSTGQGYWLVASDGGIFAFGDARFYGSTGGMRLNAPVVGMARTPTGRGYWLFASDGGIFSFGDARFRGSAGGSSIPAPAVAVGVHPSGDGYWLVLANGEVREFNVPNHGRTWADNSDPVVGIAVTPNGGGYWLARRSGAVTARGNAT